MQQTSLLLSTLTLGALTLASPISSSSSSSSSTPAAAATGGSRSYACNSTVAGNGIYTFRNYSVACGQRVTSGTVQGSETFGEESECLRSCNSVKYCVYASYDLGTGVCDTYYEAPVTVEDEGAQVDGLVLVN